MVSHGEGYPWPTGSPEELIHRRRRQVLVHSTLYYRLSETLVSDATFDGWARELAALQVAEPGAAERVLYFRDAFRRFTGETGFDLPLEDPQPARVAARLLAHRGRTD